jgi:hypothetical protein
MTTSFDVQPTTPVGTWVRRLGPAFWTGLLGAVLLVFAQGSTLGLADVPDTTVNFDDPEIELTWGTVTVWVVRVAAAVALVAVIAGRLRPSRLLALLAGAAGVVAAGAAVTTLREMNDATIDGEPLHYITSFGAWFAFAGAALLVLYAIAQTLRARRWA